MRKTDWQTGLARYLGEVARKPLAYGTHDCALFAAGAVAAITGDDPAAPFRGRYTTLRGGLRVLRGAGYADHIDLARTLFAGIPVALALPGDLAVIATPDGSSLGVVQGGSVYVLHPGGHLGLVPLTDASEAFRV